MKCLYRSRSHIAHLFAKIECASANHHWEHKLGMPQSSLSPLQAQTLLKNAECKEWKTRSLGHLPSPQMVQQLRSCVLLSMTSITHDDAISCSCSALLFSDSLFSDNLNVQHSP